MNDKDFADETASSSPMSEAFHEQTVDALRADLAAATARAGKAEARLAIAVQALKYAATCGAINYTFVIRREADAALAAIAAVKP